MALLRLTRERYARQRAHGTFPEDTPVDPVPPPAPEPPPLTRGGTPQHPTWRRVMALVRTRDGSAVNWDYVAEARTCSEAIQLASRYPYRALVIDAHGKKEYDNGKAMEIGEVHG